MSNFRPGPTLLCIQTIESEFLYLQIVIMVAMSNTDIEM